MPDKDKNSKKGTDRDVRPARGQESNVNWDETNDPAPETNASSGGEENSRRVDEETNTTGFGSSQKSDRSNVGNVGPLDADLEQLPSEKRRERGSNSTGSGLG
jgi:hypothetical protein